jgi:hypothetical protein
LTEQQIKLLLDAADFKVSWCRTSITFSISVIKHKALSSTFMREWVISKRSIISRFLKNGHSAVAGADDLVYELLRSGVLTSSQYAEARSYVSSPSTDSKVVRRQKYFVTALYEKSINNIAAPEPPSMRETGLEKVLSPLQINALQIQYPVHMQYMIDNHLSLETCLYIAKYFSSAL